MRCKSVVHNVLQALNHKLESKCPHPTCVFSLSKAAIGLQMTYPFVSDNLKIHTAHKLLDGLEVDHNAACHRPIMLQHNEYKK